MRQPTVYTYTWTYPQVNLYLPLFIYAHPYPWMARLFHKHFGSRDTIYWFRRWKDSKFTFVREYTRYIIYIYIYVCVCVCVSIRGIYITCSSLRNSIDFVIFPSRTIRLVPVAPLLRPFSTPLLAGGDTAKCIYRIILWNIRFFRVDLKVLDSGRTNVS